MAARLLALFGMLLLTGCQHAFSITAVNRSNENIGIDVISRERIVSDAKLADVVLGPGGRFEWATISAGRVEAKIKRLREGAPGEPLVVTIPDNGTLHVDISTDENGLVLHHVHAAPPEKP